MWAGVPVGVGSPGGYNMLLPLLGQVWCCSVVYSVVGVPWASKAPDVIAGGFVGWEPHSGRKQSCYLFTAPGCKRF